MTRALTRFLLASLAATFVVSLAPAPASADGMLVDVSLERTPGRLLPPRLPAAPRQVTSEPPGGGECTGLRDYEIVRSATEVAQCSPGNMVLGGTCPTSLAPGQGPSLDGTAWECFQGPSIAICANVCSELPPATGACCTGEDCIVVTAEECGAAGGDYQGDGTACDDETCLPTGACCLGPGECLELTELECADGGGDYVGDGIQCDDDAAASCFQDPVGACCIVEEPCCLDGMTDADCNQLGGGFLGPGSLCEDEGIICFDGCPPPPGLGACCIELECNDGLSQENCENAGGEYIGNGILCQPGTCDEPLPTGACCLEDATCNDDVTQQECELDLGGVFQGAGVPCEPTPCTGDQSGACCLEEECTTELSLAECLDSGGEWQGTGSTCEPDPCGPEPTGACCYEDPEGETACEPDLTEDQCLGMFDGFAWFAGLACDSDDVVGECGLEGAQPAPPPTGNKGELRGNPSLPTP